MGCRGLALRAAGLLADAAGMVARRALPRPHAHRPLTGRGVDGDAAALAPGACREVTGDALRDILGRALPVAFPGRDGLSRRTRPGRQHQAEEDSGAAGRQPQAADPDCLASWIGGHGTVPNEQKTQQSPGCGRRTAPQPLQS
jgi:hypothetical protein